MYNFDVWMAVFFLDAISAIGIMYFYLPFFALLFWAYPFPSLWINEPQDPRLFHPPQVEFAIFLPRLVLDSLGKLGLGSRRTGGFL